MKTITSLVTVMVIAAMMMTGAAFAQVDSGNGRVNGIVVNGNTTTVFEAANDSDLKMDLLKRWDDFAQQHPRIAHQVGNKPALIDNATYLRKHPELEQLFEDNPHLLAELKRNPGNFVANPSKSEE